MICVAWSSLVEESTAGLKGTDASVWPLKHGEVHSTVCEALTRLLDSEAQWHGQDSREVEAQWHFINPLANSYRNFGFRIYDSEAQWHGQDSREVEAQWHFINPHIETSVSATWYQDVERVPNRGMIFGRWYVHV